MKGGEENPIPQLADLAYMQTDDRPAIAAEVGKSKGAVPLKIGPVR